MKVFRWKAIGPLAGLLVVLAILWRVFADRVAKHTAEHVGTTVLGAKVEIARLHVDLLGGRVALRGLTVASPFEPFKNLVQAEELSADLHVLPLLEKKVVIERLAATGLAFGTTRTTPGVVASQSQQPATRQVGEQVAAFGRRFRFPALTFAGEQLVVGRVDPTRLETVRAALRLVARADTSGRAWTARIDSLDPRPAVDSTRALLQRLQAARPTDLALLADARRQLDAVRRLQGRVADAERRLQGDLDVLREGAAALEAARQRDYAFARGLMRLPSLDAAGMAGALFGPAAVARFERALYWSQLARAYLPPGLRPQAAAARPRARLDGNDVRFPRARAYPGFLLEQGELSLTLGTESQRPRAFAARLRGLTTQPALYGRPTTVAATGPGVALGALLDHTGAVPRDSAAGEIADVTLPELKIPELPLRLAPGRGTVGLSFALDGDRVRGRWTVRTAAARWVRDSGAAAGAPVQRLVERVLSGVTDLDLAAEIGGTLAAPTLAVRSNLDEVLARRMREVLGEEIAAADRKLRTEVDHIVDAEAGPARARVAALADDLNAKIGVPREQLREVQQALEARLRELTRGLPGIRLP